MTAELIMRKVKGLLIYLPNELGWDLTIESVTVDQHHPRSIRNYTIESVVTALVKKNQIL